jgi:hypothetical protein
MENFLGREAILAHWEEFMDDIRALAGEYESMGWDPLVITPGDVTPVSEEPLQPGLDVLVPDDDFSTIQAWIDEDGREFDRTEVYRQEKQDVVFLLITLFDEPSDTAILVPLYYHTGAAEAMIEAVEQRGHINVSLRPLSGDASVVFELDSPGLFLHDTEE